MGDKYRRQKIKQGQDHDLEPEWQTDKDQYSVDEKLEFLNGRIDGLLYAWDELTGWQVSDIAELVLPHETPYWRTDYYNWIDLTVVRGTDGEMQCPWCGDIHDENDLLWFDAPDALDTEQPMMVCDECATPWIERERVAEAEARRAKRRGGQMPIDAPTQKD